jgi:hypothetical protein
MNDRDNQVRTLDRAALLIQQVQEVAKKWMEKRGFEVKQVPDSRSPATAPTPVPVQNHSKNPKLNTRSVYKPPAAQQAEADKAGIWREAWREDNVQVWGRTAENSLVIPWLHPSETPKNQTPEIGVYNRNSPKKSLNQSNSLASQRPLKSSKQNVLPVIYRTSVTGRVKDTKKSNDPTQIGRLWHRMYPIENPVKDANNPNKMNAKQKSIYLELLTIFPDGSDEFNNFLTVLQSQPGEFKPLWLT